MARVYREAPLNSVWEGTANMMCMDVRRAMVKDPRTIDALLDEVRPVKRQDARFDALVTATERLVRAALDDEFLARPMTESVARVLQASELMRHGTQEVADTFFATRCAPVSGAWGSMFGTLGPGIDRTQADRIVERALVAR